MVGGAVVLLVYQKISIGWALKVALYSLRQLLATESPFKMMKLSC